MLTVLDELTLLDVVTVFHVVTAQMMTMTLVTIMMTLMVPSMLVMVRTDSLLDKGNHVRMYT
jgi:hypothetical protein